MFYGFCTCTVPYYWDCLRLLLFFFFSSFLSQFQRVLSFFFSSLFFFVSNASQSKICSLQLLSNFWFFLPLCKKRDKREKETKRNEKKTTEEKRRNPRAQPTAEKKQWQCDERKKVETTWKLRGNQSGQRERRKCGPDDGVGGVWVYTQFRVCSLSLFFFFLCSCLHCVTVCK